MVTICDRADILDKYFTQRFVHSRKVTIERKTEKFECKINYVSCFLIRTINFASTFVHFAFRMSNSK